MKKLWRQRGPVLLLALFPISLSLSLSLFLPQIGFAAKEEKEKDEVVAVINGTTIRKSHLEKIYQQNLLHATGRPVTRRSVLDDLINRELGIQKAKKAKLNATPIVKQKMEDIMYHAQISKDLESKLKEIKVNEKDIKRYYLANREYRTAQIFIRVPLQRTKKQEEIYLKRALEIHHALKKNPKKFAELAAQYSESSTAVNGGDMGFQPAMRLAPEYHKILKGKNLKYISPPVRSQFGYHLIKLLGVRDYSDIDKKLYKKIVYDTKRDRIIEKYFVSLRDKAKITINKQLL